MQRSETFPLCLEIDVTSCSDEQLRDGGMPFCDSGVERCASLYIILKIDITASCYELFRDGRMTLLGSKVERSGPMVTWNIYFTSL